MMLQRPENSSSYEEFSRALHDLARLARDGIPGCASASVTVRSEGNVRTMSASDDRARAIDEEQYACESGPCLSAMRRRLVVSVPDYDNEVRWPHVTAKGRAVGVHSSLSLPQRSTGAGSRSGGREPSLRKATMRRR